jgi:hypothetical protein
MSRGVVLMAIPYYIEDTTTCWIKDNIAPYGTNIYYIQKISGYSPDDLNVLDVVDNFDDNNINSNKFFVNGQGTKSETGGTAYVACTQVDTYPRFVTALTNPLRYRSYIIEYDVKLTGVSSEGCRMGYTPVYFDNSNDYYSWFIFFDSTKKLNLRTRINGSYGTRWTGSTVITLNTWYKIKVIRLENNTVKVQLLNSAGTLIEESGYFSQDVYPTNSLYFGQRTGSDAGYWDNIKMRRYASTEPTVTITTEGSAYKVKVINNLNEELHDFQIQIPASSLGTLTATTSLCIDVLYKTPTKKNYYKLLYDCTLDVPNITRDIINTHTLTTYNTSKTVDRFNSANNSTVFNGTDTRAVLNDTNDLDIFNLNAFTFICWIKQIGDYSTNIASILSKAANTNANRWHFRIITNEIGAYIQDADSTSTLYGSYSPLIINDNKWHMITFVRDGTSFLVYKDSVYLRTWDISSITNFSNSYAINIGCNLNNSIYEQYFNGNYGEILLFAKAFTATDVINYYTLSNYKYIEPVSHHIIKF